MTSSKYQPSRTSNHVSSDDNRIDRNEEIKDYQREPLKPLSLLNKNNISLTNRNDETKSVGGAQMVVIPKSNVTLTDHIHAVRIDKMLKIEADCQSVKISPSKPNRTVQHVSQKGQMIVMNKANLQLLNSENDNISFAVPATSGVSNSLNMLPGVKKIKGSTI